MLGWLLDILYVLAVLLTSPLWLTRMIRHRRYRSDWGQRLGRAPRRYGLQPVIWIHGVSVGEVNAAKALVGELHAQLPDFRVAVSSSTDTGMAAARRLFAPAHVVFRYPADFTFAVRAALRRVSPSLVVLMEGDVWPNFLRACRRRGVPVIVANARLGPRKGFPRYRLIAPLARRLFNGLTALGVQHESYAAMFRRLGVRSDKLVVTGMMKYDTAEIGIAQAGTEALRRALGLTPDDRLLVAGGTGAGEETAVLSAFTALRADGAFPRARLALVPRKPERFDEVARRIGQAGLPVVRRSERPDGASPDPADAVILGDTMGELRKFYALAAGVFVGRSLTPEGGSDMIEAAALAKPVCFGPHTYNFPQAQSMVEALCARRVGSPQELAAVWRDWLADPKAAADLGRKAQQFVRSHTGATRRTVEMICRLLGRDAPAAPGGIATDTPL